jgi:hypothetical protein
MKSKKLINKTKKFLGASLLAGAIATNAFAEEKKPYFFDFGGGGVYESQLINDIENIPVKIRTVESYYDPKRYRIAPIEKDNVQFNGSYNFANARIGKEFNIKKNIKAKVGLGFDLNLFAESNRNEGDNSEIRFYAAKPSCESTWSRKSVYYDIHPTYLSNKNKWIRPHIFSEIEFKVKENNQKDSYCQQINLALGCQLLKEKIVAENGYKWVNYSDNKDFRGEDKYDLADLIIGTPYASLRWDLSQEGGFFLDFGLKYLIKKDLIGLGKEMDMKFNKFGWFVGAGIRMNNIF